MASFLARTGGPLIETVRPAAIKKILGLAPIAVQQLRNLNVQEHVSYSLLNEAKIPTPRFAVAKNGKEANDIATKLKTDNLVLKAQVLAGGRGKGTFKNGLKGGVRVVYDPQTAEELSSKMIDQLLVTKQTGAAGRICKKVMVAERKFPRREFYFAVMMERAFNGPVLIASKEGGVDIEEVAASSPDAILYEPIDIGTGLTSEQAEKIVKKVGLGGDGEDTHVQMLLNLYDLFVKKDALLVEINPYAEDAMSGFFALDAKLRFDDNAEFRQKELFALRDWTQEDPKEVEAAKYNLNYIALDGTIGCMVNGAGLAMATMDIIKLYGGEPANFLDVGGGATAEAVKAAFKIITSDPKVLCILVNIFGGIMRCDVIAEGIISATKDLNLNMPVVVRLQGTKVKEARELIRTSGLKILARDDLDKAADLAVHLAQIVKLAREMKMDVNFEIPDAQKGKGDCKKDQKQPDSKGGKKSEKKDDKKSDCTKKEEKKKEEKKDICEKKGKK
uniref:Succinate--CoA ligase [ADP-forming] subunit beta, mitochondrial n=2 Tax=Drosophila melanogaster TaxID=7227 RepID=Q9VHJ8_DROME|nr:Succinyl-coenzyme A synthetase beta subunit, ADP-forming, isoform B [Drosophila melanogaster]NP_649846.2 Succinyl-coenzyme A synthetase beta subunit, ADP-forming, isoform A [Drosophila melanogaster]AAF54308.2 Succinyl-coenzyme A synthetase beta subunit, ADP-forming, isoform A [Drosophila melanogaster]ABW08624.1 Succinyl-coenzyme A synthetase beta subunit, ADP-forming, isoform B [Drosophila melanogaster]|eukprot:NP_001097713.1 skpA associated protein, isoform B [Drosophila melanogaster]